MAPTDGDDELTKKHEGIRAAVSSLVLSFSLSEKASDVRYVAPVVSDVQIGQKSPLEAFR